MMSEAGKKKIAMSLYNAFATYKAHEEGTQAKTITSFDEAPAGATVAEVQNEAALKAAREVEAKEQAAREAEEKAERQLKQTTLADCMEKMRIRIGEDQ